MLRVLDEPVYVRVFHAKMWVVPLTLQGLGSPLGISRIISHQRLRGATSITLQTVQQTRWPILNQITKNERGGVCVCMCVVGGGWQRSYTMTFALFYNFYTFEGVHYAILR